MSNKNELSFDFSALESQAKSQLYEMEGYQVKNGVLMKYSGNKRNILVPSTVEEIYNSAFENNELVTFVEIEEGVRIIGEKAFKNCKSLVKINIPSTCMKLYESAFEGTHLESVAIPNKSGEMLNMVKCTVSQNARSFLSHRNLGDYISPSGNGFTVDIKRLENDTNSYLNQKARDARLAEERRQEQIRQAQEAQRQADAARKAEAKRLADIAEQERLKREADERAKAEAKRRAEEARLAEIRRKEEEKRRREQEKRDAEYNAWKDQYLAQIYAQKERENKIKAGESARTELVLGTYKTGLFAKKPIEWIVVDIREDRALLVSKYAIDYMRFNESKSAANWQSSTIRAWLNGKFLKKAFTDAERESIMEVELSNNGGSKINLLGGGKTRDRIFLLSGEEAQRYFGLDSTRVCKFTSYADLKISSQLDHRAFSWTWWLRTNSPQKQGAIQTVYTNGKITESSVIDGKKSGVRPAMWVRL